MTLTSVAGTLGPHHSLSGLFHPHRDRSAGIGRYTDSPDSSGQGRIRTISGDDVIDVKSAKPLRSRRELEMAVVSWNVQCDRMHNFTTILNGSEAEWRLAHDWLLYHKKVWRRRHELFTLPDCFFFCGGEIPCFLFEYYICMGG